MVLILWKYPFLAFPPLFIYLRQDLKCSSAKHPSSSRFSFLVLPSMELEAFTNIPGHLFILSYVPLLPQLCSHLSVDMPFPLWNLADIWAAMSYITLPLSCVPHSLHPSIQLSKNLLYESVYVILSGLTILGDHPSSSDFKKMAGVQHMLAIQELLFYLKKKNKIAFSPTSGTLIFSRPWTSTHIPYYVNQDLPKKRCQSMQLLSPVNSSVGFPFPRNINTAKKIFYLYFIFMKHFVGFR